MKYYLNTEFIEDFHKPLFGKRRHHIDLISIALKAEDGRELYLISSEYEYEKTDLWIRENVIPPMHKATVSEKKRKGEQQLFVTEKNFQRIYGLKNRDIARKILEFINPDLGWPVESYNNSELVPGANTSLSRHFDTHNVHAHTIKQVVNGAVQECEYYFANPQFYGYYSHYEWVLFCSLFGKMTDLPKGFPLYCRDLKQTLDETAGAINQLSVLVEGSRWTVRGPVPKDIVDVSTYTLSQKLELLKSHNDFPREREGNDTMDDARWRKSLDEFLINFRNAPENQSKTATV